MGSTPPPPPPPPPGWQPGPPPGAPVPPPPPARRTPWGLVVGIVLAVVVLLGVGIGVGFAVLGDDTDDDTTTAASDAPETTDGDASSAATEPSAVDPTESVETEETTEAPSPTVQVDTSDVVGSWEGAYECGQGDTGLSLEISEGAAPGELAAIFHFRKIPSNPDVPEGSYKMVGFLEDGKLRLRRLEWIDRPERFVMVGLNARITEPDPQTIAGTVSNVGCGAFEITRS